MVEEVAIKLGTTRIKGIRTNSHSGKKQTVDLVVGTRYYECLDGTKQPSFYIKEGAVTGYESFHITEDQIKEVKEGHGWCHACAGTHNSWDTLEISGAEMQEAFRNLELL